MGANGSNVWIVRRDAEVAYRLSQNYGPGGLDFVNETAWDRLIEETVGRLPYPRTHLVPLPPGFPRLEVEFPRGLWEAPDYILTKRHPLVSRRFREAARLPAEAVQYLDLDIRAGGAAARAQDYTVMRVLTAQKAMDFKRSRYGRRFARATATARKMSWIEGIEHYVPRADLVPKYDLFWDSANVVLMLATDALAERVMQAGCTGIEFRHPESIATLGGILRYRGAEGVMELFLG